MYSFMPGSGQLGQTSVRCRCYPLSTLLVGAISGAIITGIALAIL